MRKFHYVLLLLVSLLLCNNAKAQQITITPDTTQNGILYLNCEVNYGISSRHDTSTALRISQIQCISASDTASLKQQTNVHINDTNQYKLIFLSISSSSAISQDSLNRLLSLDLYNNNLDHKF